MSAYSDYKCGAIEEWQYRAACRQEEARENREPNPCKGCPNFEIQDAEDGCVAYCLIGEENCDRNDGECTDPRNIYCDGDGEHCSVKDEQNSPSKIWEKAAEKIPDYIEEGMAQFEEYAKQEDTE